ncbi:MAG: GNAT family N-acetyltransferase [Leifsonia sp.]|nr:GNAT family N-acetyltransferase [Leifsonia sp.]
MSLVVERMPIPESLDAPGGADFVEMVVVRNAIEAETSGLAEMSPTAQDLLPHWQDAYSPQVLLVARVDGRIVGRATVDLGEEGAVSAYLGVQVLAEHRRRGIGTALLEAAEAVAREAGRTVMQGDGMILPEPGPQLDSPTGHGSVPAGAAAVRFALHHGYALGQVVRGSRLALPFDAALAPVESPGYRVLAWEGAMPEERLDDIARLHERMATDAPSADLEVAPETWDADRVRALDALRAKTGTAMLTSVVEHIASGTLVAFSELSVPPDTALAVHQQDTLVLREHRGHRLGMLAKVANLELLGRRHPGHSWVITFNAEENRPMLDVNEAIGFVPFVYEAVWKKQPVLTLGG